MTARPILMSAPMVQALLDGRKTQTRRIAKLDPRAKGVFQSDESGEWLQYWDEGIEPCGAPTREVCRPIAHSYGRPGDFLWVRETWGSLEADHPRCSDGRKPQPGDRLVFRANPADDYQWGAGKPSQGGFCWRPSIHMPRWASRLTLELTDVRVERLQDITDEDAKAEGCFFTDYGRTCFHQGHGDTTTCPAPEEHHSQKPGWMWAPTTSSDQCLGSARHAYGNLWNSINGPDSWAANPWVWVLTFKVHHLNVARVLAELAA